MINYYYEIKDGVAVFGRQDLRYLALFDTHPGRANGINWTLHDQALQNSSRAWMENANGVTQILPYFSGDNIIDKNELVWIKLRCHDIEQL
jgi:hypothetical protein